MSCPHRKEPGVRKGTSRFLWPQGSLCQKGKRLIKGLRFPLGSGESLCPHFHCWDVQMDLPQQWLARFLNGQQFVYFSYPTPTPEWDNITPAFPWYLITPNSLQLQLLHNSRGRLDRRLHLAAHKCSLPCPGGQQAHSLLSFHPETWKSCNYEQWKTSAECIEWMEETFSWSLATLVLCLDRPPSRRVLCIQMLTYRFCFHQSDRGELRLWFCPIKSKPFSLPDSAKACPGLCSPCQVSLPQQWPPVGEGA